MSVDTTKDPIFQTFQAIWDCLEAETTFAAHVATTNRIKYTADYHNVDKPGMTPDDMPQVRVTQTGLRWRIGLTSNSSILTVLWAVEVKTGSKYLEDLTVIQWAVYLAMSRWKTYLEAQVSWANLSPLKKLIATPVETEYKPRAEKPEPAGWTAVWTGGTELWFDTTDLNTGET